MEEEIDDFIGVKGKEIHEALEELRKNEIKFKVGELKAKLPQVGRCVICTLRLPCKHFTSLSQMPKPPEPELTPTYTSATFNVTDYLPKLTPEAHKRGFSVKYKGNRTVYNFDFNRRHTSLPNEKRLKQLEVIESYREEKLKKEIQKINQAKEQEEVKKIQQQQAEERRRKHMNDQKIKINQYKQDLAEKNSQIQEFLQKELEKKKKQDDRYQQYIQEIKAKLSEYHAKKDLLKKISVQKVEALEQEVIHYKAIKVKHLNK